MKIAVIAANGRSGREFVAAALQNGHSVHAGYYGSQSFAPHPKLTVMPCNATDPAQLRDLMKNCDAAASFIGHVRKSPPRVQTEAIKNVIAVAEELRVKRIISLTGNGVRYKGDKVSVYDWFLNISINLIDPNRVADGKQHVQELENSSLDYTVIRVLKLTNGAPQPYTLTLNGPVQRLTSRKTVALACLEVLERSSFVRQAPLISKVH